MKELDGKAGEGFGRTYTDMDFIDLLKAGYTRREASDGENCPEYECEVRVFSDGFVIPAKHTCLDCKYALFTKDDNMRIYCTKKIK